MRIDTHVLTFGDRDESRTAFDDTDVGREGCLENCASLKVSRKMGMIVKRCENRDVNVDRFQENDLVADRFVDRYIAS